MSRISIQMESSLDCIYTYIIFASKVVQECIINSLRWSRFGPKKFEKFPEDLIGEIVIITGANSGIGKWTAKEMVKLGAKVFIDFKK